MKFYFTESAPNGVMAVITVALSRSSHATTSRFDGAAANAQQQFRISRRIANLTIREVFRVPGDSFHFRLLIANIGQADIGKHDLRIAYVHGGEMRRETTSVPPIKKGEQHYIMIGAH